jgi:hypothetical protein
MAGVKTTELFAKATETAVPWAKASQYIRWFTDGERRYAQQLWQRASVYLSALRRRCSAYRRRQNLYAKNTEGLQRAVTVQRLVHNWVRPHGGLREEQDSSYGDRVISSTTFHAGVAFIVRLSLPHVLTDQCPDAKTFIAEIRKILLDKDIGEVDVVR